MVTIYHNPRCSKSREALTILENSDINFHVIKYLEEPLTVQDLQKILSLLHIKPIQLVRKNEAIWKENYLHKKFTDARLIDLMIKHPKLIERPIVVNGKKAAIGRPPQQILEIL